MIAEVGLLFAAGLLVPLGLRFIGATRVHIAATVVATAALAASYAQSFGTAAAVLAAPWLIVTLAAGAHGALRLLRRRTLALGELGVDAALAYLAVGGAFAFFSRAGIDLGFPSLIVLLTAVHYTYAGFLLTLMATLAYRRLGVRVPLLGAIAGMPLVAAGITFSPLLEWLAAWMLALAAIGLAIAHVRMRKPLLVISGLSLFAAMLLAGVYALAHYLGRPWIGIPEMLPTHGALNAAFALCGLLGWSYSPPR